MPRYDRRHKRPPPKSESARRSIQYFENKRRTRERFNERLAQLGYNSYHEYIVSPSWSGFRKRALNAWGNNGCVICRYPSVSLHHTDYSRGGQERFSDVIPLCEPHHRAVHEYHDETFTSLDTIAEALRFVGRCSAEEVREILAPRRAMRANGE